MNRTDRRQRKRNIKPAALIAAAVVLASAFFALNGSKLMPSSISEDTGRLMSDTAGALEDSIGAAVSETVSISGDTEELLSASIIVLQNPDFLRDSGKDVRTVDIGPEEQEAITKTIMEEWPETTPPWNSGYAGMCENWVCDVYHEAGLPTKGSCCASESRDKHATSSEIIPAGAMIYSGDDYSSGKICEVCGKDPGHVAIYLGGNLVAGSQSQYIMTLSEFKEMFGYGGWSFSGNSFV